MPAQGKRVRRVRAVRPFYAGTSAALGLRSKKDKALKGRDSGEPWRRPFRAWTAYCRASGRCPGLACHRAFGPRYISVSTVFRLSAGFQLELVLMLISHSVAGLTNSVFCGSSMHASAFALGFPLPAKNQSSAWASSSAFTGDSRRTQAVARRSHPPVRCPARSRIRDELPDALAALVPHLTQQRLRLLGDFGDEKLLNRHARLLPHHGSAAKDAFWPAPARRARMHGRRTRERPPGANSIFARMFPPGQRRAGFHRRALFSPNQRLVKAGLFSAFRMAQSTICCAVSLQSLGPALRSHPRGSSAPE